MSQKLSIEISDEFYNLITEYAENANMSPSQWLITTLEQQLGIDVYNFTEKEKQLARERFERHFGEVDLNYAIGVDNEQIDMDIVREYSISVDVNITK